MLAVPWFAHVARAQTIRGVVTAADSVTPVGGVIVLALDSAGGTLARALSDARGQYTLALARSGMVTVRALRIGARPVLMPAARVDAGRLVQQRIVLSGEVVALPMVSVRSTDDCRSNPVDGALVAQIWDEARKAMLAAELSSNEPVDASWVEFEQTRDPETSRCASRTRATRARRPCTRSAACLPNSWHALATW